MKAILVILLALCLNLTAQDPIFTSTQQSLIHLNPSFTGSNGMMRYQGIYRNQWYNLTGGYKTFYNSFDTYIKPMRGGLALSYLRDDQGNGTLTTDHIDLTYAQHLSFLDQKLKIIPSLQFSYFQKTMDYTKLNFGDMVDPRRGFVYSIAPGPPPDGYVTRSNIDLSGGLVVNYKHFYIGGSVFHLLTPDEGIMAPSKVPMRLSLFTSYNLFIKENILLNAMYRFEKQQDFYYHTFSINALFFKHLIVETGIASHAAHTSVGFRHHYFSVLGSYIFGINNSLGGNSGGSYELAASFNLRNKDNRKLVTDFERW